ncbi:hypothetical protein [Streptomyces sp. NPDC017941]|uniref:hypothetical protein n=1 Tax=Streptomyces sp. NPDC017941 TaxID=3365018 RepID=UPI0037A38E8B
MIEALDVLLSVLILWIIGAAAILTAAVYALAAIVACAWQAVTRRHTGPSWARGPLGARNARTRTRRHSARTEPHSRKVA